MHRGQKNHSIIFLFFLYLTFIPDAFSNPLIIAHRGASGEAPENTMVAFKLAWELELMVLREIFTLPEMDT